MVAGIDRIPFCHSKCHRQDKMKSFFLAALAVLACAAHLGQGSFLITSHPADQVAIATSSVSLSCSADGAQVDQWLHKGKPVVDDDAHDINTSGGSSTLTLTSFRAEQSGEYRCQFSTDDGIALSLPGVVRYFGEGKFSIHPEDFNSYVIINDISSPNMRAVIAFDCSFEEQSEIARPKITWQRCLSDGSFADVEETTQVFNSGSQTDIPIYVFFQSGFTGYFQILDYLNEATYDGTSYRCKASSTLPGDTSVAYSDCATVTFHSADVPVPTSQPFRTVPKLLVAVTEEDNIGVMACSVERNDAAAPLQIVTQQAQTVVEEFEFTPANLPSTSGYKYIPKTNLLFNLTDLDDPASFTYATFTCQLEGTEYKMETTFVRHGPIEKISSQDVAKDTFAEGTVNAEIIFEISANSRIRERKVLKDGVQLALDGTDTPMVEYKTGRDNDVVTHTLTIPTVTKEYEGIYQFEVGNKAGRAVEYHEVAVKLKARAESESTTINAFISQDLEIVCKALGNSGAPELMVFVWRRNGQALRIEPLGTVNGHAMDQFILRNITEADAGTYECHPENTVGGQNFTSYTIQVRPIEPPAISNVDVTSVPPNDSYVTVCWDSEDYTGKVIDHYVVEILLVTSRDAEVIKSVNVPAWQNCTNISIPEATPGSRYGARINAIGRGGLRLTDTTEYTLETEPGRVDNLWWVTFLSVVFGLIALCIIFCVFFICCLFLCPAILDSARTWQTSFKERHALEERDEKEDVQRAPTPDSVSSI